MQDALSAPAFYELRRQDGPAMNTLRMRMRFKIERDLRRVRSDIALIKQSASGKTVDEEDLVDCVVEEIELMRMLEEVVR